MNFCPQCGQPATPGSRFCGSCGASLQMPPPGPSPNMPPVAAPYQQPLAPPQYYVPIAQKSSTAAVLLTILLPGLGHLYLGLSKKGTPYVVVNGVLLVLSLLLFVFWPISVIAWLVTLLMTVTHISEETELVNRALRDGVPVSSLDRG